MAQNSVAPDHDRLTFADGFVLEAPCRSSFDAAMALIGEHGGVKTHQTLPKDADALVEVLLSRPVQTASDDFVEQSLSERASERRARRRAVCASSCSATSTSSVRPPSPARWS